MLSQATSANTELECDMMKYIHLTRNMMKNIYHGVAHTARMRSTVYHPQQIQVLCYYLSENG